MDLRLKILLGTVVVLVFGGITAAVVATVNGSPVGGGKPKLTLDTSSFDFGEVAMADGLAKRIVNVQNTGDADLKISKIETSCMCTTAVLEVNGQKSEPFGMPMHGSSAPLFWSATLKPGEAGSLEIIFDPNAHGPDAVGPVTRTVAIFSNSGGREGTKSTITFEGDVVKGVAKKTQSGAPVLSVSQNGVTVTVQSVKRENGQTLVEFSAENHAFDLASSDVKGQSKLASVSPASYEIKETQMGGHHIDAVLIFDGNLAGPLIIGFNRDLIFNLAIE